MPTGRNPIDFAARSLLPVLLLALPGAPTSAGPAKKVAAYGIPRLAPGQVWVSSVPLGLEVRAGEDPMGKKVLGRTPLVVSARDLGPFVTVSIQRKEYGGELPSQTDLLDLSAKTTHSTVIRNGTVDEDLARALTYKVRLPGKQTVIALFQSRSLPLAAIDRFYPPGTNFRFSDEVVRKMLARKGVPTDFVPTGIRLLHRGGKVALPGRDGWLVAEATASGRVELVDAASRPPD